MIQSQIDVQAIVNGKLKQLEESISKNLQLEQFAPMLLIGLEKRLYSQPTLEIGTLINLLPTVKIVKRGYTDPNCVMDYQLEKNEILLDFDKLSGPIDPSYVMQQAMEAMIFTPISGGEFPFDVINSGFRQIGANLCGINEGEQESDEFSHIVANMFDTITNGQLYQSYLNQDTAAMKNVIDKYELTNYNKQAVAIYLADHQPRKGNTSNQMIEEKMNATVNRQKDKFVENIIQKFGKNYENIQVYANPMSLEQELLQSNSQLYQLNPEERQVLEQDRIFLGDMIPNEVIASEKTKIA